MLKKLGVVKSKTKGYQVFNEKICPDFLDNKMKPSEYVNYCWNTFKTTSEYTNNSINGAVFELIIASLFIKENIIPLNFQAKVAFVPNCIYDMLVYCKECGPIGISAKTSLRERYKQADLEAIALKYVHRKAENYLLTLDKNEAKGVSDKIKSGDVLGINAVYVANEPEFDDLIEYLKGKELVTPGKVEIVTATTTITKESIDRLKSK